MADPSTPAPLEQKFVEYMTIAGIAVGSFSETNPAMANFAKGYFRAIYRAMYHFMNDHMYIQWTGDPDLTSTETKQKLTSGGPQEIKVLPWKIINEAGAWSNENPIP